MSLQGHGGAAGSQDDADASSDGHHDDHSFPHPEERSENNDDNNSGNDVAKHPDASKHRHGSNGAVVLKSPSTDSTPTLFKEEGRRHNKTQPRNNNNNNNNSRGGRNAILAVTSESSAFSPVDLSISKGDSSFESSSPGTDATDKNNAPKHPKVHRRHEKDELQIERLPNGRIEFPDEDVAVKNEMAHYGTTVLESPTDQGSLGGTEEMMLFGLSGHNKQLSFLENADHYGKGTASPIDATWQKRNSEDYHHSHNHNHGQEQHRQHHHHPQNQNQNQLTDLSNTLLTQSFDTLTEQDFPELRVNPTDASFQSTRLSSVYTPTNAGASDTASSRLRHQPNVHLRSPSPISRNNIHETASIGDISPIKFDDCKPTHLKRKAQSQADDDDATKSQSKPSAPSRDTRSLLSPAPRRATRTSPSIHSTIRTTPDSHGQYATAPAQQPYDMQHQPEQQHRAPLKHDGWGSSPNLRHPAASATTTATATVTPNLHTSQHRSAYGHQPPHHFVHDPHAYPHAHPYPHAFSHVQPYPHLQHQPPAHHPHAYYHTSPMLQHQVAHFSNPISVLKSLPQVFSKLFYQLPCVREASIRTPNMGAYAHAQYGSNPDPPIHPDHMRIALRRIETAIHTFGGYVAAGDSKSSGGRESAGASPSSIFRRAPPQKTQAKPHGARKHSDRFTVRDNYVSWDVEDSPMAIAQKPSNPKKQQRSRKLTKQAAKGGSGAARSSTKSKRDQSGAGSPSSSTETDSVQRMKYRCKLCGQWKQNHQCPFQHSLQRDIGISVSPTVNAYTSQEPGELAPPLSKMNNFVSYSADRDTAPGPPLITPDAVATNGDIQTTGTAHSAWNRTSIPTSPSTPTSRDSTLTTRSSCHQHTPSSHRGQRMHSMACDESTGSNKTGLGDKPPASKRVRRDEGVGQRGSHDYNAHREHHQSPHHGYRDCHLSDHQHQPYRRRHPYDQYHQHHQYQHQHMYPQIQQSSQHSVGSASRGPFLPSLRLRSEHYRAVSNNLKREETGSEGGEATGKDKTSSDNKADYDYPPVPLSFTERKRLSDTLYEMCRTLPMLKVEVAGLLRVARNTDHWDLCVAECLTQMVVAMYCRGTDHRLDGLMHYLLHIGVSC